MYIVYIWPTGVAGGRAVPPDVRRKGSIRPFSIKISGGLAGALQRPPRISRGLKGLQGPPGPWGCLEGGSPGVFSI